MNALMIADVGIKQDAEGRYCLNDLHRAAGGEKRHQPSNWLMLKQTSELIEELSITGITGIESKQGLGTFAAKQMVYAYAMWISPKFHLKVINIFDAVQNLPAIPADPFLAQMEMVKTVYLNQLELKREQEQQKQELVDHSNRLDSLTPRLTASSINKIQGAISHAAKWYRQSQAVKHIKLSVNESCIYFQMMLLDKFKVADINYIDDVTKAFKYLQTEAKKHQVEYQAWIDRNSLFAK